MERALAISRAPIFLGVLAFVYGNDARAADARQILSEMEDRRAQGEYVPAFALFNAHLGLEDLPEMRAALAQAIAERAAPLSLSMCGGEWFDQFRSDPEIDRLRRELYGS